MGKIIEGLVDGFLLRNEKIEVKNYNANNFLQYSTCKLMGSLITVGAGIGGLVYLLEYFKH